MRLKNSVTLHYTMSSLAAYNEYPNINSISTLHCYICHPHRYISSTVCSPSVSILPSCFYLHAFFQHLLFFFTSHGVVRPVILCSPHLSDHLGREGRRSVIHRGEPHGTCGLNGVHSCARRQHLSDNGGVKMRIFLEDRGILSTKLSRIPLRDEYLTVFSGYRHNRLYSAFPGRMMITTEVAYPNRQTYALVTINMRLKRRNRASPCCRKSSNEKCTARPSSLHAVSLL